MLEIKEIIAKIMLSLLPIAVILVNYVVIVLALSKLVKGNKTPWWVWVVAIPITLILVVIYYFAFPITKTTVY